MTTNDVLKLAAAAAGIIALLFAGVLLVLAVKGNNDLTAQMTELDQKAYTACVTAGHWSPVECRVGEYGAR